MEYLAWFFDRSAHDSAVFRWEREWAVSHHHAEPLQKMHQ
jgi:hypothetical protein